MGQELYQLLEKGLQEEPPTSIRLNPFKCDIHKAKLPLADGMVPWCPTGWYLQKRPGFTFDPLMHAGLYYVQDASSMFLDEILRQILPPHPVKMLDLCAAPGGKSTLIRAALPETSVLFANDPTPLRAQILNENILKFGHPDVVVTANHAADYRKSGLQFDLILVDAPCSGEGMFRKDADAISSWSPGNVAICRDLQRQILEDIWPSLKPGGMLIYSTCTLNALENEDNVAWLMAQTNASPIAIDLKESWQITGALTDFPHPVYRFIPGKTRGEGLFMAVLKKPGTLAPTNGKLKIPKNLRVLSHGIRPDVVKGSTAFPDHSKAMSVLNDKDQYPKVAVSYDEAIRFLRKEAVNLPQDTPKGIALLTFRGTPIGFEKNIGNRANNLYPHEWRIKSAHIPDANDCNIIDNETILRPLKPHPYRGS